ncbi:hypothetical protein PIB30_032341 [Stylosanthes scabra]|uniref:Uncharacterized protein n=1 Tax=Stylosanthes scabra TaxID=79078 RepID=A0ABU6SCY5_9FABA|nr:hypothetical protein [Stylosanthes scabra]
MRACVTQGRINRATIGRGISIACAWQWTPRMLVPREVGFSMAPPEALVPFMREAGFSGPLEMRSLVYDDPVLSAFVERWWPDQWLSPPRVLLDISEIP